MKEIILKYPSKDDLIEIDRLAKHYNITLYSPKNFVRIDPSYTDVLYDNDGICKCVSSYSKIPGSIICEDIPEFFANILKNLNYAKDDLYRDLDQTL